MCTSLNFHFVPNSDSIDPSWKKLELASLFLPQVLADLTGSQVTQSSIRLFKQRTPTGVDSSGKSSCWSKVFATRAYWRLWLRPL